MQLPSIDFSTTAGKTVLLRLDLNVPVDNGKVLDDFRIQSSLPTLQKLQTAGAKVVVLAHLGRPKIGEQSLTLAPVAEKLAELLGHKFVVGSKLPVYDTAHVALLQGDLRKEGFGKVLQQQSLPTLVVLENLRFYEEEEKNDDFFASKLARLGDLYINDAFGVSHRKAASVVAITSHLPSFAGPLLRNEVAQLSQIAERPASPFVLLMAGIKIDDKVETLKALGMRADKILLGGGLANSVFQSRGYEVGLSRVDQQAEKTAFEVDQNFKDRLVLPEDVVVADENFSPESIRAVGAHQVRPQDKILDIGPKAIYSFSQVIKQAKTVVWNGPLGQFERRPFHHGTIAIAKIVGSVGTGRAFVVVGGGETVDAVRQAGQAEYIDHLSTGGGAMLEFLAGKKLPGVEALISKKSL